MTLKNQKILSALLLLAGAGWAAEKQDHDLFNPVPRDQLRPLSADRPDATESPYTVDAGHVQLEIDIVAYLRDRSPGARDGTEVEGLGLGITNVKLGVTRSVDVQLVIETFVDVETTTPGATTTTNGFGDLTLRVKINLWGNDGGETAFAVMPFLKFPTNQDNLGNNDVEGGIIFPFGMELPNGWGLGLQIEFDIVRNAADNGYDLDFAQTIVIGHALFGDVSAFLELASVFPADDGTDWIGTINSGLTWLVNPNLQFDIGVNVGISRDADDLVLFLGVTKRF